MITKITKEYEGKTIYALGTGNNASRGGPTSLKEWVVSKVKRKYFDVEGQYHVSFCCETGITESSLRAGYTNAGYRFFESEEDHRLWKEYCGRKEAVRQFFSGHGIPHRLPQESVERIYKEIETWL